MNAPHPRRPSARGWRASTTAVGIALLLTGCAGTATFASDTVGEPADTGPTNRQHAGTDPAGTVSVSTVTALLGTLPVKGRAPATGYVRSEDFGTAWLDVDRNGCDTRDDVLARDLDDVVRAGPCRVTSGHLVSPYTGASIAFTRGPTTSTLVQIDHLVALMAAWQTGAQQLAQSQREALANDPLNLLAVDQHSNEQKGAGDAVTWLPASTAFRCEYVARQVEVKARYGLWVTPAEHDAIARILAGCADTGLRTTDLTGAGAGADTAPADADSGTGLEGRPTSPASAPTAGGGPGTSATTDTGGAGDSGATTDTGGAVGRGVVYANCDAVRAAGAAPIHANDPGYSRTLDRDGDGIACE